MKHLRFIFPLLIFCSGSFLFAQKNVEKPPTTETAAGLFKLGKFAAAGQALPKNPKSYEAFVLKARLALLANKPGEARKYADFARAKNRWLMIGQPLRPLPTSANY
ncbi:MAG: hypothetical protein R2747_01800 [Pyrinomonadaceae bacterium]